MSRTAHHIRARGRRPGWVLILVDLRYPAAEMRAAVEEGRRPCPRTVRRRWEVYSRVGDEGRDDWFHDYTAHGERSARARVRDQLAKLRQQFNAASDELKAASDESDAVDVLPYRHRRDAVWQF